MIFYRLEGDLMNPVRTIIVQLLMVMTTTTMLKHQIPNSVANWATVKLIRSIDFIDLLWCWHIFSSWGLWMLTLLCSQNYLCSWEPQSSSDGGLHLNRWSEGWWSLRPKSGWTKWPEATGMGIHWSSQGFPYCRIGWGVSAALRKWWNLSISWRIPRNTSS